MVGSGGGAPEGASTIICAGGGGGAIRSSAGGDGRLGLWSAGPSVGPSFGRCGRSSQAARLAAGSSSCATNHCHW